MGDSLYFELVPHLPHGAPRTLAPRMQQDWHRRCLPLRRSCHHVMHWWRRHQRQRWSHLRRLSVSEMDQPQHAIVRNESDYQGCWHDLQHPATRRGDRDVRHGTHDIGQRFSLHYSSSSRSRQAPNYDDTCRPRRFQSARVRTTWASCYSMVSWR